MVAMAGNSLGSAKSAESVVKFWSTSWSLPSLPEMRARVNFSQFSHLHTSLEAFASYAGTDFPIDYLRQVNQIQFNANMQVRGSMENQDPCPGGGGMGGGGGCDRSDVGGSGGGPGGVPGLSLPPLNIDNSH